MSLGEATIPIVVDLKPLKEGLAKAKAELIKSQTDMVNTRRAKMRAANNRMKERMGKAGKEQGDAYSKGITGVLSNVLGPRFSSIMSNISKFGGKALKGPLIAAVAAVVVAIMAIVAAFKLAKAALTAFVAHERLLNRINAALRLTAQHTGHTTSQIREMTKQMSRTGVVAESELLRGAAVLTTFTNITGQNFRKSVEILGSMSRAMGTDVRSAAIQLGKALNDPKTGLASLRESGISFTTAQKDMIFSMQEAGDVAGFQNLMFKIMADQGISDNIRATDTLADQWDRLKNAMGQLLVSLGRFIGVALEGKDILSDLATVTERLADAIDTSGDAAVGASKGLKLFLNVQMPQIGFTKWLLSNTAELINNKNAADKAGGAFETMSEKAANAARDLRNKLSSAREEIVSGAKKMESFEATVAKKKEDRADREIARIRANVELGINEQIKAIRKLEQAKKDAQPTAETRAQLKEIGAVIDAKQSDLKFSKQLVEEEKKRRKELEKLEQKAFGVEQLFEQRIQDTIKRVNDEAAAVQKAAEDKAKAKEKAAAKEVLAAKEKKKAIEELAKAEIKAAQERIQAELVVKKDKLAEDKRKASVLTGDIFDDIQLAKMKDKLTLAIKAAFQEASGVLADFLKFRGKPGVNPKLMNRALESARGEIDLMKEKAKERGISVDSSKVDKQLNIKFHPTPKQQEYWVAGLAFFNTFLKINKKTKKVQLSDVFGNVQ